MPCLRVRIYSAENSEREVVDVIGASASAREMFGKPGFIEFMKEHRKDVGEIPRGLAPAGGVSIEYRTVHPPLDELQLEKFGQLCVGGSVDGRRRGAIVDTGDDGICVIDNRHMRPRGPYDTAGPIIAVGE